MYFKMCVINTVHLSTCQRWS